MKRHIEKRVSVILNKITDIESMGYKCDKVAKIRDDVSKVNAMLSDNVSSTFIRPLLSKVERRIENLYKFYSTERLKYMRTRTEWMRVNSLYGSYASKETVLHKPKDLEKHYTL